jgi:hypothetical protein
MSRSNRLGLYMTSTTLTLQCPHCGAANEAGGQFCQACGKALPSAVATGPRILGAKDFATTSAGQKLQGDELIATSKKAKGALLTVAIIQTAVVAFVVWIAQTHNTMGIMMSNLLFLSMGIVAVVFWGLYIWARRQPLPAAIVGLVLYATLVVVNVITAVHSLGEGGKGTGFGGIGIGWLDIVIMAVLGQAITAGVKHRQLMRQDSFPA